MRQAVRFLRRSLGDDIIVSRGDDELAIGEDVLTCDVAAFEDAVRAGDHARALALYRGPLLDGFFVDDAPGWDRWLEEERDRLRRMAASCATQLADSAGAAGDWPAATDAARRACALAPGDEAAVRRLLDLLARSGDRAGALAEYDRFVAWMAEELELAPDEETVALSAAIHAGQSPSAPAPAPLPHLANPLVELPGASKPETLASTDIPPAHAGAEPPSRRRWLPRVAAAVVLLSLVWAGRSALPARTTGEELHTRRVLVAPFENLTGDSALDALGRMAADRIIQGLTEMRGLEVLPFTTVVSASAQDRGANMLELAREVRAGRLVSGSYYLQRGRVVIQARVTDAAGGGVLRALDAVDVAPDAPLVAVDLLRDRLRAAIAPELHPESHSRAGLPPPSYEAYRDYISGMEAFMRWDFPTALSHMERAAAGEAEWAMPRIVTAIVYLNLQAPAAADSVIRQIAPMRESLGPMEAATYDMVAAWLRGDDQAAYAAVLRQRELAPGTIGHYQVAEQARRLNRPREAVRVLRELSPDGNEPGGELRGWRNYWRELTWSLHMLGQHRAELQEARRARTLYPDDTGKLLNEARALAALGRVADVEAAVQYRLQLPPDRGGVSPGGMMRVLGLELLAHDRVAAGRALLERAAAWYRSVPPAQQPAFRLALASTLYDMDDFAGAREVLVDLLADSPDHPQAMGYLGLIAAAMGDEAEAQRISDWLRQVDAPFVFGVPTYMRARIAARLGDPAAAAQLVREAMATGRVFGPDLHIEPEFRALRRHPAMAALLRPAG